jgi:hypothetical protein
MNAAALAKSERLQRVYNLLRDRREHSTMEIIQVANVCAVNSIISELRANGKTIRCQRRGDVWYYRLTSR